MRLRTIVLLVNLIVLNFSYSQNLFNLYKDHLPQKVLENEKYQQNINSTLETYSELDPKLIYVYLKHLQLKLDFNIQNPDSNFKNFLAAELDKFKKSKKKWAQKNINQINEKYNSNVKIKFYKSFFTKYIFDKRTSVNHEGTIEYPNVTDFFRYIYLSGNGNLSYDESSNYKELCSKKENEIILEFEQIYHSEEQLTDSQVSTIIEKAFEYSFLFKKGYLSSYKNLLKENYLQPDKNSTSFFIDDLLDKYYKTDFASHNNILFYFPFELIHLKIKDHRHTFKITDPFNHNFKISNRIMIEKPIMFYFIGFQIKTREEYNPFSFIKIKLGYSMPELSENSRDLTLLNTARTIGGLYFKGKYSLTKYKDIKSYAIATQFTTPIFYLTKNFFFEFGFRYSLQNISFKYDFIIDTYDMRAHDPVDEAFFDKKVREYSIKNNYYSFSPILSAGFFMDNGLSFSLDYIIPNIISLGVGYRIRL